MKATTTKREAEALLSEMVNLVRNTYVETMPADNGRGLARLERSLRPTEGVPRAADAPRWLRVCVASCAAAVLIGGGALAYRHASRLTYQVVNGSIGPGGFVRPSAAGAAIVFSEGSEITLGEAARTRVDALTADGGRVVLENGSVNARIVPLKAARWSVEAGPYTIRVTGTVFNVRWSWTEERLDLQMDRGSVIVTGPLAPSGVTLTAGMRFTANPRSGLAIERGGRAGPGPTAKVASNDPGTGSDQTQAVPADTALQADIGGVAADGDEDRDEQGAKGERSKVDSKIGATTTQSLLHRPGQRRAILAPARSSLARSSQSWERMLARGDVQGILEDAQWRGLDRVLVSASGSDLCALADAARYGHRPTLARRALLSLRERFPRSGEARDAAFFMGGLAEDAVGGGGPGVALDWYGRYLQESGRDRGRYAAQALGRKMVLTQRLQGAPAARPVASEYLEHFPGGPYASAARKLSRAP